MRYTFTIEIPDKRGSHENDHVDFLKAASKQIEETLDYATSREGKRLMAKLKEKAGCSETELIEECWEAADEVLGKKSNAVLGEALTGAAEKKKDPFAKVAQPTAPAKKSPEPVEQEEEEQEEEAPKPVEKPSAPAKKFPFKKKLAAPEPEPEEDDQEEDDLEEDEPEEASAPPPPKAPAKKFPAKKFPFKKAPSAPTPVEVEEVEGEEELMPEQAELLPDEDLQEEAPPPPAPPAGPPSSPPSKGPGVKRPAKGMTGFAKKSLPFKKLPKFKKP